MMEEKMANPSWAQVTGHSSAEHVVHQFTAFTSVCRSITLHGICARTRRHRRHSALLTCSGEFGVDASFHSAEWHAARIAALTTERLTWDEWKEQQKHNLMSEEAVV